MTQRNPFEAIRDAIETKAGKAGASTLIILGALGLAGCAPNVSAEPEPTKTSTETPSPEVTNGPETEKPWYEAINTEPTADDIILDANEISTNELPQILAQKLTMWLNAGYTKDFANESLEHKSPDFYDISVEVGLKYDKLFEDNLLIDGWESNPRLKVWMEKMAKVHADTIYFAAKTSFPNMNRGDEIPYMRESQVVDVLDIVNNPDGSITITTTERDADNADKNRVGEELSNNISIDGHIDKIITTYVIENGTYKIADMQFVSL
jgi:hypothetical protein